MFDFDGANIGLVFYTLWLSGFAWGITLSATQSR